MSCKEDLYNVESLDGFKRADPTLSLLNSRTVEPDREMEEVGNQRNPDIKMEETEREHDIKPLVYRTSDNPPLHLTLLLALQIMLMSLSICLTMSLLVAEFVCAEDDHVLKARMVSTTMVLGGITTFAQVTVGVRLPLYQGPAVFTILPLLNLKALPEFKCPPETVTIMSYNISVNISQMNETDSILHYRENVILPRIQSTVGCLALASMIQVLVGITGVAGLVMKFIGPLTVTPALMLLGLNAYQFITKYCQPHWGIATITGVTLMILSVYLNGRRMPIPVWTPSKGCHIIRYPLHQVFSVLIATIVGWIFSLILTKTNVLSNDRSNVQFKARTDAKDHVIVETPWFYLPYPGQFGPPGFSSGLFIAFLTSTLMSIADSIADYHLCATMVRVPPPPVHAINRGLIIEGFCSILSGFFGASHSTTTFADYIGLIGITKVASRVVFQAFACLLIVFGVMGKFAAVLITIPYPVLGGVTVVGFGMYVGIVLSILEYVDMKSTRNMATFGTSTLLGLMIPFWIRENPNGIETGSLAVDSFVRIILSNPFFITLTIACLLDNTLPGTFEERGMNVWGNFVSDETKGDNLHTKNGEGYEVYEFKYLSSWLKKMPWTGFVPFSPNYNPKKIKCCRKK